MKSVATFTWDELLSTSEGELVTHYRGFDHVSIDTDTRTVELDTFFLPIVGQQFNGNDFIEKAYQAEAQGAFVTQSYLEEHPDLKRFPNLISVPDTLITYLKLAEFHRNRMKATIVGITGSSGKTTTKEMLYAMLAEQKVVQKSEKNFNNEIGVPMTLLNLEPETEILILEMAMRGLGQIKLLSDYAHPDIGLITNIGPAHIGLLGSMEAITQAKCEIVSGMDVEEAKLIVDGDNPLLLNAANQCWDGQLETFSLHDVDNIKKRPDGKIVFDYEEVSFLLGLPGSHNVMNMLACIRVCQLMGVPLKKVSNSLAEIDIGGDRWRQYKLEGSQNCWIINDAYNSNPSSLKVALKAFIELPNEEELPKVAIIGAMAELGEFSHQYHTQIGEWLNTVGGLDALIAVGEDTYPIVDALTPDLITAYPVKTLEGAVDLIQKQWPDQAMLFLKGSRECCLEKIPEQLSQQKGMKKESHVHPS